MQSPLLLRRFGVWFAQGRVAAGSQQAETHDHAIKIAVHVIATAAAATEGNVLNLRFTFHNEFANRSRFTTALAVAQRGVVMEADSCHGETEWETRQRKLTPANAEEAARRDGKE